MKNLAERACRDLEKVFGPVLVREIKPAMVEKYQHQRLQEPTRYGKPRSEAKVNRTIAVLKRLFNLAVREELMEKNPVGGSGCCRRITPGTAFYPLMSWTGCSPIFLATPLW